MRKRPVPFPETVRQSLRRGFRLTLKSIPLAATRRFAARIPFTRLSHVVSSLLWGQEVVEWHGVRIEVNPGQLIGYYAYFLDEFEVEHEVDRLIELCRNARTFVDVGANAGWVSLAVTQACPDVSVLAFEPEQGAVGGFRANVARNSHLSPRIQLFEQAVGDINGTAHFLPSSRPEHPETSRLADEIHQAAGYPVPVTRLDTFFEGARAPDVVKIDVEGAELRVLRGMAGLFARGFPRAIMIETHAYEHGDAYAEFNAQIVAELEQAGFTLSRLQDDRWISLTEPLGAVRRAHLLALRE